MTTKLVSRLGSKKEARAFFKELLRTRAASGGASALTQEKMIQHLQQFLAQHSGTWGSYRALPSEASVSGAEGGNPKLSWVYPRMIGSQLEFVVPSLWATEERFGIAQPVQGTVVPLDKIQGLLIPGLAFDRWGNRLGRGKGYYDQTLASFNGLKVGVAFSWQVSQDELPHEDHDVKMNYILTEAGLRKC